MSICKRAVVTTILAACLCGSGGADEGPALGEEIDADRVLAADFTVLPDGRGLPPGSGDAVAGARVYAEHCVACHGEGGEGGSNDRLAGGQSSLTTARPVKTVGSYWPYATTIFDYVRRAMPYPAPGSLSDDDVYAVTAYLLNINGIVDEAVTMDAATLPRVRMPNRDNFVLRYPQQ